ncbi:MAG: cation transporter [Firmicutes bacterium]|nr:cation transporter [Bacillota bacterium]
MNEEKKILIKSMACNGGIAVLKIGSGIFGKSSSLIADGMHTFSDFVTDIIALIGSYLSKKRPNKLHPFGYGKVEYVTNSFIGIIISLLGIYIFLEALISKTATPSPWVIGVICFCLACKFILCLHISKQGKKLKSNALINASKESFIDAYSSLMILAVNILMQFSNAIPLFRYLDKLGSVVIASLILHMAFNILKENVVALIGEQEDDAELIKQIEEEINKIRHVEVKKITLLKYGFYYRAHIKITINENIRLSQLFKLEDKINITIKNKKFKIRYSTIEVVES